MQIAFVGLGNMGGGMAANLVRAGHRVHAFDLAEPARARAAVGKEVVNQYYADEAEKVMGPVCKYLERHGVTPQRVVKVGAVGETIAAFADAEKFDMLVMGSRGHGALATLVMGSVTTQVLANSMVPVLIVR